jgi:hypothetical protein
MKGDLLVVQSKRINPNIQSIWGFQKIHGLFQFTRITKPQEQQQHSEVKRTNQVSISTALTSRNAENLFWVGRLSERTMALTSSK